MISLTSLPAYTAPPAVNSDWHDLQTIQLGELIEGGFDPFGDEDWASAGWYSDEQRARVEQKFTRTYEFREISVTPPGKWRRMLTARALEEVPKFTPWYKLLDQGVNPLIETDEWTKNRSLYSDFPATRLNPQLQDYASNATDNEYERLIAGNLMDAARRLRDYRDVDAALVDVFATFFTTLASPSTEW